MIKYIPKSTLQWPHLWQYFGMEKDNGGRWYPTESTEKYVVEFLDTIRAPSRSWPDSYAHAMLRQKFAKLVVENEPELALKLGIAQKEKETENA